ncbi:MAG: SGNH/GDSL hydrolase family protein [Opitutaceae bacterium]|jgi:acyl-CoA thioesterase-1|nr:SGNH/GDSL hydrolase family protein [Opitutaceae bacterium]
MKSKNTLACLALLLAPLCGAGIYDSEEEWKAAVKPPLARSAPFAFVKEDPSLPNALVIGDSISIGYTAEVRALLVRKFNVFRVPDNAQNTTFTLENIDAWLEGKKWAVIHCNWGLHDLTSRGPKPDGYAKNLEILIDRLRATGAVVVFATSTPVPPDSIGRAPGAELPYNARAREVMRGRQVFINDLHAAALPRLEEWQLPADVHFSAHGSAMLAQRVARAILGAHRGGRFADSLK